MGKTLSNHLLTKEIPGRRWEHPCSHWAFQSTVYKTSWLSFNAQLFGELAHFLFIRFGQKEWFRFIPQKVGLRWKSILERYLDLPLILYNGGFPSVAWGLTALAATESLLEMLIAGPNPNPLSQKSDSVMLGKPEIRRAGNRTQQAAFSSVLWKILTQVCEPALWTQR